MNIKLRKIISGLKLSYENYFTPYVSRVSGEDFPYKVLISTLLSLRTKDAATEKATVQLFKKADNPKGMIMVPKEEIQKAIYGVGFYKKKTETILYVSRVLIEEYNGKVPDDFDVLLSIKGIGRKTANLVITEAFNKPGLCVDTHVHRISNRLGLVKTKNPYETEIALKALLPMEFWKPFNMWLVAHGQNTCHPVSPKCSLCNIGKECMKVGVVRSR
jgi:endonuclease-3